MMTYRIRWTLVRCCASTVALFLGAATSADVYFVSKDNTAAVQDGASWATAFTAIQPAIDAAHANGGGEVWIAKGVYDELRTTMRNTSSDPVLSLNIGALEVKEGVSLYGGFAGAEIERDQRDARNNVTVIDGAVARNGQPAYHVMLSDDCGEIDGFTVRGGRADGVAPFGAAGGLRIAGNEVVVRNCIVESNIGGGIQCFGTRVIVADCTIKNNVGSGLGVEGSNILVENCTIESNSAASSVGLGIVADDGLVRNCVFRDNVATPSASGGGAAAGGNGRSLTFENCLFYNNRADRGGVFSFSGAINDPFAEPTQVAIVNCTVANNTATELGSAILHRSQRILVVNSVFAGNGSAPDVGGWPIPNATELTVVDSLFDDGPPELVSPVFLRTEGLIVAPPVFVAPALGDFRLAPGSPAIDAGRASADFLEIFGYGVLPIDAPGEDLDGAPRPVGPAHDLGAYEFDPETFDDPFDLDGDGLRAAADIQHVVLNALGLAHLAKADLNRDGRSDAIDVQLVVNAALGL